MISCDKLKIYLETSLQTQPQLTDATVDQGL